MNGPTRRALLGGAAVLGAGLALRSRAVMAQGGKPPRIERHPQGFRVFAGDEVTSVRLPVAGVVSVVRCPSARLALGGGLFVEPDGPAAPIEITEDARVLRARGPGIIVEVDKATGRLRFLDDAGRVRVAEGATPEPIAGVRAIRRQGFEIGADERLHGLGQFREPVAEYRDQDVFLAHANSDAVNPFLCTTGGWGLLWETGAAAHFRSRGRRVEYHSAAGDLIRYHVCLGDNMDAVIGRYRALTGAARLLPKWAYGYWQSKERYGTQAELTGVVDEYRRRKLPLDAIVLDWRYWGESDQFSGMTFDPINFSDPAAMVKQVHDRDVHLVASIWPAFGPNTAIHREMAAGGHLFPGKHWSGGRVFDTSSAPARAIYWRHVKRGLIDIGVDGLWTDGNEPEFLSTGERYGTTASHIANGTSAAGLIAEHLLTYSFNQSKGLSEALARDVPGKRPLILSRSAYAGQQAFGAITWSGDIFASWGTLSNQIVAGVNFAMAGIPWWTCDIGGFLINHRYPDGLADPAFTELYVRWFQFCAFLPIFRAHGTHIPRELWRFGEHGTPVYDALERTLRLRYALIPYHYALAAEAAHAGGTPLRGLAMDFPNDPGCRDQHASFMCGRDLLVRVVDRPMLHAPANIQEFLPSRAVRGVDAPAATVTFYEGANFDRRVSSRLTDDLKMTWSGDLPAELAGKAYSVRWTGRIEAQESGAHTLVVMGKGAVRLVLDGRTIVDAVAKPVSADGADGAVSFKEHAGDARVEASITLERGRRYDFRLEQRQPTADAVSLWVEWITPSHRRRMTPPAAKAVDVYLPAGQDWYELDTGVRHQGGRTVVVAVPLAHIPVFVRAGAILPMTPGIDRTSARASVIEVRVHAGRDGEFTLYDDEGDGSGYRRGAASRVALRWDDVARVLHVGPRRGEYPGMTDISRLRVSLIDGVSDYPARTVRISGRRQQVSF